ncbi:unnamed protein product [Linum trigynum]|uniref:Uncharacterized protein n=1 Tax=Linum trigynum TaxID=586398 RepID=A0AAV2EWI0_9ROSI
MTLSNPAPLAQLDDNINCTLRLCERELREAKERLVVRAQPEVDRWLQMNGVPQEALRLRLFPYSLSGKARSWLNNRPPFSNTS